MSLSRNMAILKSLLPLPVKLTVRCFSGVQREGFFSGQVNQRDFIHNNYGHIRINKLTGKLSFHYVVKRKCDLFINFKDFVRNPLSTPEPSLIVAHWVREVRSNTMRKNWAKLPYSEIEFHRLKRNESGICDGSEG